MSVAAPSGTARFWETLPLEAMSRPQWESLCDRCGRCCLHKLRDDDDTIHFTDVACRLLDPDTAECADYARRARIVPDCVRLTPDALSDIDWLPPSCAYRLVKEGKPLPAWHPLLSGDEDSVARAGASVRGRVISERDAGPLEHHMVDWPGRMPRPPRRKPLVRRRQ